LVPDLRQASLPLCLFATLSSLCRVSRYFCQASLPLCQVFAGSVALFLSSIFVNLFCQAWFASSIFATSPLCHFAKSLQGCRAMYVKHLCHFVKYLQGVSRYLCRASLSLRFVRHLCHLVVLSGNHRNRSVPEIAEILGKHLSRLEPTVSVLGKASKPAGGNGFGSCESIQTGWRQRIRF
jgi:hypothetical protein